MKLFGIGIYSALLGQDRTVSKVCELINKPRSKKDAKIYYKIDSDDVDYKSESEGDVNEVEIQNILNHYKRLGKNEEEYVRSFDNIAEQYTDAQLRVICKFLPLSVKAVLEANSQKYQELITFGTVTPSISQGKGKYVPNQEYQEKKKSKKTNEDKLDLFEKNIGKSELTKPVIIPSVAGVKKVENSNLEEKQILEAENLANNENLIQNIDETEKKLQEKLNQDEIENILQSVESNISTEENSKEPVKKKRGRPKKVQVADDLEEQPKKKRGRPKKIDVAEIKEEVHSSENSQPVDLFGLGQETEEKEMVNGGLILPGLDEPIGEEKNNQNDESFNLFNLGNEESSAQNNINYNTNNQFFNDRATQNYNQSKEIENVNEYTQNDDQSFKNLLSMSNKLVAFVGTSKNGTSFIVNSMAEILSKKGINVAILDLTKNKNSYYIYTKNEEELRKKAFSCVDNLTNGIASGIEVNKNLTVFTTLPDRSIDFTDYKNILTTLTKNYSLVIMDCDYETNYAYFEFAQEIYLVQSFDILTIQPLTAFLRNLKSRNILDASKLRIVLNKVLRVRTITEKIIIGGMSSYNDPSMSYMTELFDKDNIKYCSIPFDQETYSRYLDGLVNCEISTKGYPKNIIASLEKLGNMMYPLLNNDRPANKFNTYNPNTSNFSSNMNATLNKMKNRY